MRWKEGGIERRKDAAKRREGREKSQLRTIKEGEVRLVQPSGTAGGGLESWGMTGEVAEESWVVQRESGRTRGRREGRNRWRPRHPPLTNLPTTRPHPPIDTTLPTIV